MGEIEFAVHIGLGVRNLGQKRVQDFISSPNLNVKIGNLCILTNFKSVLWFSLSTKLKFMMCTKTNHHLIKCVVGVAIMAICVVISTSLYFGIGGGSRSKN